MFHIHRMFHHCWVIYKADGERAGRTPGPVLLTSGWSEAGQFGPSNQHFDILSLLSDSAVIYVNTLGQSGSGPVQQELQWFWTGSSQWEGPVQWRRFSGSVFEKQPLVNPVEKVPSCICDSHVHMEPPTGGAVCLMGLLIVFFTCGRYSIFSLLLINTYNNNIDCVTQWWSITTCNKHHL